MGALHATRAEPRGLGAAVCVWPARAVLGEGPCWSARDNAVYWVDIKGPALHRLSLADGGRTSWPMPEMIGWVIERRAAPGFIAGFASGVVELTLDPVRIRPLIDPEFHLPDNRLNDAKADASGAIWFGSMDNLEQDESGALYRLGADGDWSQVDDGYHIANGPAFSPDGKALYHTDTAKRRIYRFDLQPDGRLSEKRVLIDFPEAWGWPDGMTTDAEGGLWVAHWGGGRLSRFSPEGELDRTIPLPVSQVTSCCFAGPGLERMFVTTAAIGREDEPLAGALFEVEPGVAGAPVHAYAG